MIRRAVLLMAFLLALILFVSLGLFNVGTKVKVQCGAYVTTPPIIRAIDIAANAGKITRDLEAGKYTPQIVVDKVRAMLSTAGMLKLVWQANSLGTTEPDAATGWRNQSDQARQKALDSCCPTGTPIQPPDTNPQGPDDPPFDPKSASFVGQGQWTTGQLRIAATIIAVGKAKGVPEYGWIIGIAAGLQESGLRNLNYGDRDSLGVFQQRAGWGSEAQRRDPTYAAAKFYDALKGVNGWQRMTVTRAAQTVQVSGYPNAYAKWADEARSLVAKIGGATPAADPKATPNLECTPQPSGDQGAAQRIVGVAAIGTRTVTSYGVTYRIPIPAGPAGVAINFALDQLGDPYRWASHGPNTWDCSGLTAGAWKAAGYPIYPQSGVQRNTVPAVRGGMANAQPGDVLWHPGHVQLYLGRIGGQTLVVEAPRTGLKVRVVKQWMTPKAVLRPTLRGSQA